MLNWIEYFWDFLKKIIFAKGRVNGAGSDIFMVSFCHREGFTWTCWVNGKPELVTSLVNLGRTPEQIFVAKEGLLTIICHPYLRGYLFMKLWSPTMESGLLCQCLSCHGQRKVKQGPAVCVCLAVPVYQLFIRANISLIIFGLLIFKSFYLMWCLAYPAGPFS